VIDKDFLAKTATYSYDVGLASLKEVGIIGDCTWPKSSDDFVYKIQSCKKSFYTHTERSLVKDFDFQQWYSCTSCICIWETFFRGYDNPDTLITQSSS